jgi:hypothetical protein
VFKPRQKVNYLHVEVEVDPEINRDDAASITSTKENELKIIENDVKMYIQRRPAFLTVLMTFGALGILSICILVVINLFIVQDNYIHLTEDSINRMLPDVWIQSATLSGIGINVIHKSYYSTLTTLTKYRVILTKMTSKCFCIRTSFRGLLSTTTKQSRPLTMRRRDMIFCRNLMMLG